MAAAIVIQVNKFDLRRNQVRLEQSTEELGTLNPEEHGRIVKEGYDRIAEAYCRERSKFDNSAQIEEFISHLPEGGVVLDIGCGGGTPVLHTLLKRGFHAKGIDFSKSMLDIARRNAPGAELILADVTKAEFEEASLDGIISTYTFIHIHRNHHQAIYKKMLRWLKPHGVIMIGTGSDDWCGEDEYYGVRMVWNHAGPDENKRLVQDSGFDLVSEKLVTAGSETHHWILARKPAIPDV